MQQVSHVTSDTSDVHNQIISINFPFIAVCFGAFHIFPLLVEGDKTTIHSLSLFQKNSEMQLLN